MEAGGIALAILGGLNNSRCYDLTHCATGPQISKRFARTIESFAHRPGRGVVEPTVLDRNTIHRDLPKTYKRERGSVSQSPRPEAASVMAERWSFDGELSGQNRPLVENALTCRLDRLDVHSN